MLIVKKRLPFLSQALTIMRALHLQNKALHFLCEIACQR